MAVGTSQLDILLCAAFVAELCARSQLRSAFDARHGCWRYGCSTVGAELRSSRNGVRAFRARNSRDCSAALRLLSLAHSLTERICHRVTHREASTQSHT